NAGRRYIRTRDLVAHIHQVDHLPLGIVAGDVAEEWYVGQLTMLAAAVLDDDVDELAGEPIGLVETREGIAERAFDLAPLERDLDLVAVLVAGHNLELVAENLLHDDRYVDAQPADAGAAHDKLLGLCIVQRLHRRRMPDVAKILVPGGIADPP